MHRKNVKIQIDSSLKKLARYLNIFFYLLLNIHFNTTINYLEVFRFFLKVQ